MNWLLALMAFAAIMAVLSTIVSVLVEALHKVFAMRSGGLREMMRGMHATVVAELDPEEHRESRSAQTKAAKEFASIMTRAPAYNMGGRSWGVGRYFSTSVFSHRYQNLSNLEFAEQLPRTEFGKRLAAKPRPEVRQNIQRLVWQLDRFGESQTGLFRRRAKMFTTLVSLAFVLLANINAIAIYRYLAEDKDAAQSIITLFDVEAGDDQTYDLRGSADTLAAQLRRVRADIQAGVRDQAETTDLIDEIENFQDQLGVTTTELSRLTQAGLPMGRAYYPYCAGQNPDSPGFVSATPNCEGYAQAETVFAGFFNKDEPSPLSWVASNPQNGAMWFLSAIATAGLLGLGAPFWFNSFRALAVLADRRVAVPAQASTKDGATTAKAIRKPAERTTLTEADVDAFTDAFLMQAGQAVPAAGKPAGGTGGKPGIRQVHG